MEDKTVTLAVPGMHCESCEGTVQRALQALPGVTQVVINSLKHRVIVEYDDARVNVAQMLHTVLEAGFVAETM